MSWAGVVADACRFLRMDALALRAPRAQAFQLVQAVLGGVDAAAARR